MARPSARAAAAVSLLAAVGISGFASAFVSSPPNLGPTALSALQLGSLPSTTSRTTRPRRLSTRQLGLYGKGRGVREAAVSGGVSDGEEGTSASAAVEERTPRTKSRPAVATASTASGLAAGAAVVALSTLGGFPDLAAAEAPAWVLPAKLVLDPVLLYFEVAFVARIILSWYPKLDLNSAPQNLVAWPTEPILRPTRAVIPPAFGVDISPIVWVMICSLLHEILLGQQGILNLMSNK